MAKDRVVVGIDVGSSKICTIIASIKEGGPHIIGVASIPSRGMRKGQVVDIDEAVNAISASLESAERMAGCSVAGAFVSVGGNHVQCVNSRGVVAVANPSSEITREDVRRVIEAARAVSLPNNREILHVIPRAFTVDSQTDIKDPVGMTGIRLEVETHIIHGATTSVHNLTKCVEKVGVDVEGVIFSGLASAEAVLSDTEKELGVILVDIGGGTTDICMFVEGALAHSVVLPVGAKNVTNDIAVGLRVSLDTAEKIKLELAKPPKTAIAPGDVLPKTKDAEKEDLLDLSRLGTEEELRKVSQKTLKEGIMRPRLEEIFTYIGLEVQRSGFGGLTPAGLVVTGGGADTVGMVESARRRLGMQVRIGTPTHLTGLIDEVMHPAYAASTGLIMYTAQLSSQQDTQTTIVGKAFFKGAVGKSMQWLKALLP